MMSFKHDMSFGDLQTPLSPPGGSPREHTFGEEYKPKNCNSLTIIIFGASGDLAKRKLFPALFLLYIQDLVPKNFRVIGYARSEMSDQQLHEKFTPFIIKTLVDDKIKTKFEEFKSLIHYVRGDYDNVEDFKKLSTYLLEVEKGANSDRIFYLSLPPDVFLRAATHIGSECKSTTGYNRITIEKPFGRDLKSFEYLSQGINFVFAEKEIYRIDHYLTKEVIQNLLVLRFANVIFDPLWNRNSIKSVQIVFKEQLGVEGRGGYFDQYGIIRDVMQNHLMQILALIAMEQPVSLSSEDIKNEKVKVLRSIAPIGEDEIVIGQYKGREIQGKKFPGYLEDESVPEGSITPTFAACVLHIKNRRWDGVPFLLKCGKGLDESKAEIRIQFNDVPANLYSNTFTRNELVIRVQPDESIYFRIMNKEPGIKEVIRTNKLDFSYKSKTGSRIPDAYERLILDVIQGKKSNFVYEEELRVSWKIFTPILRKMEELKQVPEPYHFGSRGPVESDQLPFKYGCKWSEE